MPGSVLGCDFSGVVVRTGNGVTVSSCDSDSTGTGSPDSGLRVCVGDHVAGFVMGSTFPDRGAYAEYVKTPAELAWIVPEGTLTHEEAATLGCAYV